MNKAQDLITPVTSYELVAREYYDPERHPTCANFREASRTLFQRWLKTVSIRAQICEVGAGKSLLAEILSEERTDLQSLALVDESPSMLEYSEPWRYVGVRLDLASAFALPYGSESFDIVASCLGDPYNSWSFWVEVCRVLKPNGTCLFTTPSFDWAKSFRGATDTDALHSSAFDLVDGSQVSLPSYIYPEPDEVQLMKSAKLTVSEISQVSIRDLSGHKLSSKLMLNRGADASVVTGYVASKESAYL
jgi:SAM-dependent methyltransferase